MINVQVVVYKVKVFVLCVVVDWVILDLDYLIELVDWVMVQLVGFVLMLYVIVDLVWLKVVQDCFGVVCVSVVIEQLFGVVVVLLEVVGFDQFIVVGGEILGIVM